MSTVITPEQITLKYWRGREVLAFIATASGGSVRVRGRRAGPRMTWRCDDCPNRRFTTCAHSRAVRDHMFNVRSTTKETTMHHPPLSPEDQAVAEAAVRDALTARDCSPEQANFIVEVLTTGPSYVITDGRVDQAKVAAVLNLVQHPEN